MIAFGLILAMAGIIMLIVGAAQAAQNRAFRDAQTVMGTVTYKHSRNTKNGRAYLLKLSYSVDGIEYEREIGVTATEYDDIDVGAQYKVQYRPSKPNKILRLQDTDPKIVKVVLLIGAALIVVGIALVFIGRMLLNVS